MHAIRYTLLTAIFWCFLTGIGRSQDADSLPAEAEKVLRLWVGKSDLTIDEAPGAKGIANGVLILNGRFVRDEVIVKDGEGNTVLECTILFTYDTKAKVYRTWTFLMNGEVAQAEGKWDERTRTLTFTSKDQDTDETTTVTSVFSEEGAETSKSITKNKQGDVTAMFTGRSSPRR